MNKKLFISTLIFFIGINSASYWERDLGAWAMLTTLGLLLIFGLLLIAVLYQVYWSVKEGFASKPRLILIFTMAFALIWSAYPPFGLFDFKKNDEKVILIASRQGVANCSTVFRLKDNNKFSESSVCFGTTEINGAYILSGDTIYFENVNLGRNEKEYYKFAVIKSSGSINEKIIGQLVRYKDFGDTVKHELWITKNEVIPKAGLSK